MRVRFLIFIMTLILAITSTHATLIVDGKIYMFRSQFVEEAMTIDGNVETTEWVRTGTELINLNNGNDTRQVLWQFANNNEKLFLAATLVVDKASYVELGLYFDTDGDGQLLIPEDAKVVDTNNLLSDLHWEGSSWENDLNDVNEDEFKFKTLKTDDRVYFEISIDLISTYIQYDAWQIATPSNSFIGFTFQFQVKEGNTTNVYTYPATPKNVTGYVDMKLAGPEDQDLAQYTPGEAINQTEVISDVAETRLEDLGFIAPDGESAGLGFSDAFLLISMAMTSIIYLRRRKK